MQEMWVQSLGREDALGEGNGNLLQHSCLRNPTDRGVLRGYGPWGCERVGHDLATKQQHSFRHTIL